MKIEVPTKKDLSPRKTARVSNLLHLKRNTIQEPEFKVHFKQNYYAHNFEQAEIEKKFKSLKGKFLFPLGKLLCELQMKDFHNQEFINMNVADLANPHHFKFVDRENGPVPVTDLVGSSYRKLSTGNFGIGKRKNTEFSFSK